jgi:hypothetical protein
VRRSADAVGIAARITSGGPSTPTTIEVGGGRQRSRPRRRARLRLRRRARRRLRECDCTHESHVRGGEGGSRAPPATLANRCRSRISDTTSRSSIGAAVCPAPRAVEIERRPGTTAMSGTHRSLRAHHAPFAGTLQWCHRTCRTTGASGAHLQKNMEPATGATCRSFSNSLAAVDSGIPRGYARLQCSVGQDDAAKRIHEQAPRPEDCSGRRHEDGSVLDGHPSRHGGVHWVRRGLGGTLTSGTPTQNRCRRSTLPVVVRGRRNHCRLVIKRRSASADGRAGTSRCRSHARSEPQQ